MSAHRHHANGSSTASANAKDIGSRDILGRDDGRVTRHGLQPIEGCGAAAMGGQN